MMAWFDLGVRLVEALAWPAVVLIVLLAFREPIEARLRSLTRLRAGSLEAEFAHSLREAQDWLDTSPVGVDGSAGSPGTKRRAQKLTEHANYDTRAAIIEAWEEVEHALKRAALQRIATSPEPDVRHALSTMRRMAEWDLLSTEDVALLQQLRGLKSQVANLPDFVPTYDSALRYIDLAVRMEDKLDRLAQIDEHRS